MSDADRPMTIPLYPRGYRASGLLLHATSLPSPTSDSPRKKSAAIENSSEKVVSKMLWRAGGAWLAGEWHAKRSRLSAGVYHESRGGQRTLP